MNDTTSPSRVRRGVRSAAALALLASALLASSSVEAQPVRSGELIRAEALYDEAVALMSKGRDAEACPKLEASHAIDPATGTLLALARCLEKTGRIASAWSTYVDAEAWARRHGQADREAAARERAAALLPRLPRLTIDLAPDAARVPGLQLVRNGRPIVLALAGSAMPVDPGDHVIEARAPGRRAVRIEIRIREAEQRSALIEGLAPEAAPTTTATTTPGATGAPEERASQSEDALTPLQIGGLATGGAGVVALGVGSIFGLIAASTNDDSDALCAPFADGRGGTAEAHAACVDRRDEAGAAADVSTVFFVAGGALVAAGVGLVLLGGDDGAPDTAALTMTAAPGGLIARGSF